MIEADGWLVGVERLAGHPDKTNGGVNGFQGAAYHSAEGWEPALLSRIVDLSVRSSWHFSNMQSGRFPQHYSVKKQVWTSGSGFPNNNFVTVENEGVAGQPLTEPQIANLTMLTRELSLFTGRSLLRRIGPTELSAPAQTLLLVEHNECTRWGSPTSSCPSGRIPWQEIINRLYPEPEEESNDTMIRHNRDASFGGVVGGWAGRDWAAGFYSISARADLGLPDDAKRVLFGVKLAQGSIRWLDEGNENAAGETGTGYHVVEALVGDTGQLGMLVEEYAVFQKFECLAYWK